MNRSILSISTAACLLFAAGCGNLGFLVDILGGINANSNVTVRFVNTTESDVDVEFYTSDEDNVPFDVLTSDTLNDSMQFTVAAGETVSLPAEDCDNLQSMAIDDAELQLIGGIGPNRSTDALYDGDDWQCGDTVTFTFETETGLELTIRVAAEGGS